MNVHCKKWINTDLDELFKYVGIFPETDPNILFNAMRKWDFMKLI